MPYSLQYKKLIESEVSVSKSRLKPRKIYKIVTYKYADGSQKSLSGANTAYVFCTGIYDNKLYGIKLSLIKPEKFFPWLKQLFKSSLKQEDFDKNVDEATLLKLSDKAGTKIFNSYLKGNAIYKKDPSAFRTYNIQSIGQILKVHLKKEVLASVYGITLTEQVTPPKESTTNTEDSTKP